MSAERFEESERKESTGIFANQLTVSGWSPFKRLGSANNTKQYRWA